MNYPQQHNNAETYMTNQQISAQAPLSHDDFGFDELGYTINTNGKEQDSGQRSRRLSFARLIPNLLTLLALCAGLTAIRFGIDGRWEGAVILLVGAAVLDSLDGMMARLLNAVSRFGAELDSLSDFVSFGVTPAILLYLWGMNQAGALGWCAALFLAIAVALRLARYNVKSQSAMDTTPQKHFEGVPAPAGAILALLPMIISFEFGASILSFPFTIAVWIMLVGALMLSNLPTFSIKSLKVPAKNVTLIFAGFGLFVAALITEPWLTLTASCVIYLIMMPISFLQLKKPA